MTATEIYLTIGLGLAITALLIVLLCYLRLLARLKAPKLDEKTAAKIQTAMDSLGIYRDVHIHRNRDGSVAVALGRAPEVWPEDRNLPIDDG